MKTQTKHARSLRHNQTDAERRLWYHLRAHRFQGAKFKRQKPIGSYIVDFVCIESGLIIELDGGQHAESACDDLQRDQCLRSNGFRVVRFWNNQVMEELPAVLEQIRVELSRSDNLLLHPLPNPLPLAGEGAKVIGNSK